jgi:hypothetical protein
MATNNESIRVDKKVLAKVRKAVKKTGHRIGGFYDIAALQMLEEIKKSENGEPKP